MSSAATLGNDTAWLRVALDVANVPTLACVLVHLTGDRRWIEPPFLPTRVRGMEDNDSGGLPPEVGAEIKAAALAAFDEWLGGKLPALPDPDDALLIEMMSVSLGEDIPVAYAPMIRADLGLAQADDPAPKATPPPGFTALIIGAGISGICAAIELAKAGIPYQILQRREAVGGVWFDNRYPGAACDVPSHLYSFSFAPYEWSRFFAGSREIHRYLNHVADSFDVRRNIRFGVEVIEARFDEGPNRWDVDIARADGATETLSATMVVSGVGAFNKPDARRARPRQLHRAERPYRALPRRGHRLGWQECRAGRQWRERNAGRARDHQSGRSTHGRAADAAMSRAVSPIRRGYSCPAPAAARGNATDAGTGCG